MLETKITDIRQGMFIKKIEAYLRGRGRENLLGKKNDKNESIDVEGLCNGAALLLLEKLFYDCLNRHYQTKKPIKELRDEVITNFFNDIEAIIAADDKLLDSSEFQQRLGNRKIPNYQKAKEKLDKEFKKLKIPENIQQKFETQFKSFYINDAEKKTVTSQDDYFFTLIELARDQKILTDEEAKLLLEEYIPDIPLFEKFISQIFLLQTGNKELLFRQHAIVEKFGQLKIDEELPTPRLDYQHSFIMTPENLIANLNKLLPDERLVVITLPKHAVLAFHIADEYFFYDSNNPEKKFIYCENPFIFVLKLSLTELNLAANSKKELSDEEILQILKDFFDYADTLETKDSQEYFSKTREWLVKKPVAIQKVILKSAIKDIKEAKSKKDVSNAIWKACEVLPQTLGFIWQVYCHPQSLEHKYPKLSELIPDIPAVIRRTDFANETVLMKLAQSKQSEVFEEYLKQMQHMPDKKLLIDYADRNGNTALHFACVEQDEKICDALLKEGANVHLANKVGWTPLFIACINGDIELCKKLLKLGADADIVDKDGMPILMAANKENFALIQMLVEQGADVNKKYKGHSPFSLSCSNSDISNEVFNILLPKANPNDIDLGTPVLFLCITAKKYDRVEKLLKCKADPNIRLSKDSESPLTNTFRQASALQYACSRDDAKIVELLLQYKADPNTKDIYGTSCLAEIAKRGKIELVQLLIKYGAKLEKKELEEVLDCNHDKTIELFLRFPFIAKGETKAEQIGLLFKDYANPPNFGFFPPTWRHHTTLAGEISKELLDPKNKNLDDEGIQKIIDKHIENKKIKEDGEFKDRLDLVGHFLKPKEEIKVADEFKSSLIHKHQ